MLRVHHRRPSLNFIAILIVTVALPGLLFGQGVPGTPPERKPDLVVPVATFAPLTPAQVTAAIDMPPAQVVSVNFGTSDTAGTDVFGVAIGSFPTDGTDYLVLSTGATTSALLPNDSPSTSTVLEGLNTANGQDLVQLTLVLDPPNWATCLAFDFAFLSEEFPEWVGSSFNDVFIAEYGQSDFEEVNAQVIAPYNFAYDTAGNVVSVNTVFGVTAGNAQGTTYDGGTPTLTARTPLDTTNPITIILSIMDLGDSVYDSTVLIDNFRWLALDCEPGANADSDGDALLDDWEENGIDYDGDGIIDLDLPAMGADSQHKDIFVEIDYMVLNGPGGHSHQPAAAALTTIIDTFANAPVTNPDGVNGITIHIDAGAASVMDPVGGATWGALSDSDVLAHANGLGTFGGGYNWTAFDVLKDANFSILRADVFHYCVFAHGIGATGSVSGISRGLPASDLIVSLGRWTTNPGTVNQQAGTFIHEIGHNLSLRHGGNTNNPNFKPNYLSVMNYLFQMNGLRIAGSDGNFDYSRFVLPTINENALDETAGLSGVAGTADYGTKFWDAVGTFSVANDINVGIDWDGDGDALDNPTVVNVNNDGGLSTYGNSNNWTEIVYNGGAVGSLGEDVTLPIETEAEEIDAETDALILTEYKVCITGAGVVTMAPGATQVLTYTLSNIGGLEDVYEISPVATATNVAINLGSLPASVSLAGGEQVAFSVEIVASAAPTSGVTDSLEITVVSQANPKILDQVNTLFNVSTGEFLRADANGDGVVDIADAVVILNYLFGSDAVPCLIALDVNDDELVNVADTIYLLMGLFNGGALPSAPYPDCGIDPTAGQLECANSPGCP